MIVVQLIAVIDWGFLIPAILGLDQVTVLISLRRGSSSSSSPSWRRAAICSNKLGGHHRWHTGFGSCGRRDTNAVAKGLIAATGGDLEALRSGLNERLAGLAHFTWMGSFEELCGSNQPEAKKFRGAFREDGDDSPIRPDELDDFAEGLIDDGYYVLPGSGFRPPDRPLHPPRTPSAPGSTSGRFGACCWRCTAE
jgi:hypothetical protein